MKHLSLQWRITLLTALLIACACVCMNLLLYRTGVTGMDALNGFMMQYQPGSADPLTIEIPQEEMSSLLAHFSQEVYDAKVVFGRKGWCITVVVTIVSAAIAYFVSGRALKPLQQLAQQAQQVDQDSIATTRLDENTVQEFGQLSRSVNRMLDGLAQSFELQRQFAGNAAHELRTPLAILQTKLELFAEEHPAMDAENCRADPLSAGAAGPPDRSCAHFIRDEQSAISLPHRPDRPCAAGGGDPDRPDPPCPEKQYLFAAGLRGTWHGGQRCADLPAGVQSGGKRHQV